MRITVSKGEHRVVKVKWRATIYMFIAVYYHTENPSLFFLAQYQAIRSADLSLDQYKKGHDSCPFILP